MYESGRLRRELISRHGLWRLVVGAMVAAGVSALWARPALGTYPHVEFPEVVHTADLIFVGTVTDMRALLGPAQKMIFTNVRFEQVGLINEKARGLVDVNEGVTLAFAGGQIGERGVRVSGVPKFSIGERYLVFSRYDGARYSNPLIAGTQGLYRIIADVRNGVEYPLAEGNAGIVSVSGGRLQCTPKIAEIVAGAVSLAPPRIPMAPAPESAAEKAEPAESRQVTRPESVMTLDEFVGEIRTILAGPPPRDMILRGVAGAPPDPNDRQDLPSKSPFKGPPGGDGSRDGGVPMPPILKLPEDSQPLPSDDYLQPGPNSLTPGETNPSAVPQGESLENVGLLRSAAGTPLCYCGHCELSLVMEQVPESWTWWQHNNDALWLWNQFMDVYRYTDDDGTWGDNDESEFVGFPSDTDLYDVYEYHWDGATGMCVTSWTECECCELTQSDIAFNPSYTWYENLSDTLGRSARILYRPNVMHELGHSWGLQGGSCTEDYSYDVPSVMHAYYSDIVEDGWGIHASDAWAIRDDYSDQTAIIGRKDVGVESYYGDCGLHNTTTDKTAYGVGEAITINNITVENMSSSATTGVRIRLWLSTNNTISGSDYQMGAYWYWDSFSAESYWTGSLTTTIPSVPLGTYYVGAIVTTDGSSYNWDDYSLNNCTFLYDTIQVTCPVPSAPTGVSASDGTYVDKVHVTWNAVTGASHYEVWRNTDSGTGTATRIASSVSGTSYEDFSAAVGTTYYYRIKAESSCGGISGFSSYDAGWLLRGCTPINTPVGSNVAVTIDAATLTFQEVTSLGCTTATQTRCAHIPAPHFQSACTPCVSYELATTAGYSGRITVCITYDDAACEETDLHLVQYDPASEIWTDITTFVDPAANRVCGETTRLTEFLLARPLPANVVLAVDGSQSFDGRDDYLTAPFVLDPARSPFTFEAWIKGGALGQVIVSQRGVSNWLLADPVTGTLRSELGGRVLTSGRAICDGIWHGVSLSWNGSTRTLYVDGLQVARDTIPTIQSSNAGLYIGAGKNLEPGSFWSGSMDRVRIYDR